MTDGGRVDSIADGINFDIVACWNSAFFLLNDSLEKVEVNRNVPTETRDWSSE